MEKHQKNSLVEYSLDIVNIHRIGKSGVLVNLVIVLA